MGLPLPASLVDLIKLHDIRDPSLGPNKSTDHHPAGLSDLSKAAEAAEAKAAASAAKLADLTEAAKPIKSKKLKKSTDHPADLEDLLSLLAYSPSDLDVPVELVEAIEAIEAAKAKAAADATAFTSALISNVLRARAAKRTADALAKAVKSVEPLVVQFCLTQLRNPNFEYHHLLLWVLRPFPSS